MSIRDDLLERINKKEIFHLSHYHQKLKEPLMTIQALTTLHKLFNLILFYQVVSFNLPIQYILAVEVSLLLLFQSHWQTWFENGS